MDPEHSSLDAAPVQIELVSAKQKSAGDNGAKLVIPRSYIVFANNYGSRKGPLPERFATNHIAIRFLENGEAWNVAADREGRSAERLRALEYEAGLHANANPNARIERRFRIAGVRQPEGYEGLVHFSGAGEIYVGDSSDSFELISCFQELREGWFCTYSIDISDKVFARAKFLDFRLHGGRAYANQRAHVVREFVCRFTECETAEARRSSYLDQTTLSRDPVPVISAPIIAE